MSINRRMKVYVLQMMERTRSPSGAAKEAWCTMGDISVAVYKKSEYKTVGSERYKECTHVGLTYRKDIQSFKYRLVDNGKIYEIVSCNTESRFTALMLKEIVNV